MINTVVDGLLVLIPLCTAYLGYKRGLFYIGMKPICFCARVLLSIFLSRIYYERVSDILSALVFEQFRILPMSYLSKSASLALIFSLTFILSGFLLRIVVMWINSFVSKGILGRVNAYSGLFASLLVSIIAIICAVGATEYYLRVAGGGQIDFDGGIVYRFLSNLCQ